jgi:serine/threonine-protein kinase
LSTIEHPGVVRVHDIGRDPSVVVYLVTEYFESVRLVRDGPLPPDRVMEVVAQGADALQAVHDRGVVFRNVWKGLMTRTDGTQVLNDFHVARPVGSAGLESVVTSYAAWDNPATQLTDVYDLGRLAHFLMTLTHPGDLLDRLNPLVWPDHVPPDVWAVIDRAVAVNPAERWPSAAALAEAARG